MLAKFNEVKAGDMLILDSGFDCHAPGPIQLESDSFGNLYFDCSKGPHYISGQINAEGYLVGMSIPETERVIPINPSETPTMFNPEDASSVSRFFQMVADKIVLASTLPKEVEELRQMVNELRNDVEMLRRANEGLNEQVVSLRNERQALQDENASLRSEVNDNRIEMERLRTAGIDACAERDRWHQDFINSSSELERVRQNFDDAQLRIMQLEDDLKRANETVEHWRGLCNDATRKLTAIHGALAA